MNEVISLNEQQPHIVLITQDGNPHVIPVSTLRGVANGLYPAANLGEDVLRKIVREFIDNLPPQRK